MTQPAWDNQPDHVYLAHVSIGQFFRHFILVWLGCWVGMAVFSVLLNSIPKIENPVLNQLGTWLFFASCTWIYRGSSIITWPKISFVTWLVLNVLVGACLIAQLVLPLWAALPVYSVLLASVISYNGLLERGRINYTRMKGAQTVR